MFPPSLRIEAFDGENLFLLSERAQSTLQGRLAYLVAPLIDGKRSTDEIVDLLEGQAPAAEVYYTLAVLEREGYLVEATSPAASGPGAFWQALGQDPGFADRSDAFEVSLTTFGDLRSEELERALSGLGIQVTHNADLAVVLTDDYLQPGLDTFNVVALQHGRPWLLCKPVGTVLSLGPLIQPGKTACWECLAVRLRNNRPLENYLQHRNGRAAPIMVPKPALTSTLQTGLNMAATETARWLACGQSALAGVLVTLDLATLTSERHTIVRRPQCPSCGKLDLPLERKAKALVLHSRTSRIGEAGGGRSATPEATLARYGHHVSGLTGVVTDLRRVSQDDDVFTVYTAGSNAIRFHATHSFSPRALRGPSRGTGVTDVQARASALCEALERYSGGWQGYEPRIQASFGSLGKQAIWPNSCMLFSEQQFRERESWNQRGSRSQFVPEPFDPARELIWAPIWSLTRGAWRYLPAQYCYYDVPIEQDPRYCRADSNGAAAGDSLEEAILHGFLELVERDCVAIWWYNRLQRPAVDLKSFADPYLDELRLRYRSLGREIWALDLTNDLGIPTFVALSRRTDGDGEKLIMGFGAHLEARIALRHAHGEMNQFLVALRSWTAKAEREPVFSNPEVPRWLTTATLADQPYLRPDHTAAEHTSSSYTVTAADDTLADILHCRQIVERLGMELLVLDQTRLDIGLPVVKVFVPGLRHFRPRFAPGRLYDVPVKLGWLAKPRPEEDLNPIPMFV